MEAAGARAPCPHCGQPIAQPRWWAYTPDNDDDLGPCPSCGKSYGFTLYSRLRAALAMIAAIVGPLLLLRDDWIDAAPRWALSIAAVLVVFVASRVLFRLGPHQTLEGMAEPARSIMQTIFAVSITGMLLVLIGLGLLRRGFGPG
jgi:hypothetical protein